MRAGSLKSASRRSAAPAAAATEAVRKSPGAAREWGEFALLKRLTEAAGVPGREERIREIVLEETDGLWDETQVDNMGNLICLKRATRASGSNGAGKRRRGAVEDRPQRVMLACHMDEIGFYVRYVDDEGRLRVMNVGGFDTRNLFARRVRVHGREELLGVMNPAGKPIHISTEEERKKIPEMAEFFVDLFMSKEQVKKRVRIGDPVTLVQTTEMAGEAITGKAMDNRVALWVGINAVRKVVASRAGTAFDIYFVACVQEEVGLRGAQTAAFTVEPDVGIAIDTTLACDTPGITKDDAVTTFGGGVGIKVMDSSTISHRGLFEEFVNLAQKHRIPHQLEVLPRGGTDAGALQRSRGGTRAITLSVPTRYIHTVTESVHKGDLRATVDLLAAWLGQ